MEGRIVRPKKQTDLVLPRIGKIKTGYKDDKDYPRSTDYFIADSKYAKQFKDVYGDEPKVLQIIFLDNNPAISCNERFEYRDAKGKLYAYGDGITFDVWNGTKYQTLGIDEYPNVMKDVVSRCKTGKEWSVILTLKFILPRVKTVVGYWEYSTKGNLSSIPNIRNSFDAILNLNNNMVVGIIFDLTVDFAKSQKPDDKRRYPVVNLIVNESEQNKKLLEDSIFNPSKAIESKIN